MVVGAEVVSKPVIILSVPGVLSVAVPDRGVDVVVGMAERMPRPGRSQKLRVLAGPGRGKEAAGVEAATVARLARDVQVSCSGSSSIRSMAGGRRHGNRPPPTPNPDSDEGCCDRE